MPVSLGYVIHYVPDVPATIEFYSQAFGLAVRFVTAEGDYGELDTGSTTLAFASEELAESNLGAAGGFVPYEAAGKPVASSITLVTEDVAAAVVAAEAQGARTYVAATAKPWGQTVAYLIDPAGILLELATPINSA